MKIEEKNFIGYIDTYKNNWLTGWIKEINSNKKLRIAVTINDIIVTESIIADKFRQDLLENKIGDGCYSFEIFLPESRLNLGENIIRIIDIESGIFLNQSFKYNYIKNKTKGIEIKHIIYPFVHIYHSKPFDKKDRNIIFCIDTNIIENALSHLDSEKAIFRIPKEYADGMPHILSIIDTETGTEDSQIEIFSDIMTPSEIILRSEKELIFTRASFISSVRQEGFFNNLLNIAYKNSKIYADFLNLAHSYLQSFEGPKKRRSYKTINFPKVNNPKVSIIISVHNKFEYTYYCINSLMLAYNKTPYEIIIIDDYSDDETIYIEKYIKNINIIRNNKNIGFLLSCNKAAAQAKGDYLLFLNNDTEVTQFWIDELVLIFEKSEKIGIVGSRLIYPDGRLQEAGGIIWGNGNPWNVGNGNNPYLPCFSYTREVDYISGAAMMIRRDIWKKVNGFSEEFEPAYYEDTDIAFKVREAGYKVIYAPLSTVIHYEGITCGVNIDKGIKKFQKINSYKFRSKWVRAYKSNGREGINIQYYKDRYIEHRVLMIDYKTPEPDKDAGSYASIQEISLLQENNCKVTFLPENMAYMGKYTQDLQRMGVECICAPFYLSPQEYIQKEIDNFDIVYITRYHVAKKFIESIRKNKKIKIIFNNADLHFLRELRMAHNEADIKNSIDTREEELQVMRNVDIILTYTNIEKAIILSHNLSDKNIFICPWVVTKKNNISLFEERQGIAFLGGYNHMPNVEAVEYLIKEIMPNIREIDNSIKLYVYGSNIPDSIEKLSCNDVIIKGYVENLDDVFNKCRVFVAPLLSGAGIKGKVLEALSYGVPCVLSSIAAEGIILTHGINGFISENPKEYAKYICNLYHDKELWKYISKNITDKTLPEYSKQNGILKFKKILNTLGLFS